MIVVGIPKEDLEHSSQHCSLPVSLCAGRLRAVRGLLILTSMVANVDVKLLFVLSTTAYPDQKLATSRRTALKS